MASPQVIKPDPDPTAITTENLLREVGHLKELVEARLNGIEARLDHKYIETADAIKNLRDLHEEKFKGLDQLWKQAREDNQTRLDAAFKSANDTRDKIEESLTKQIDNLSDKVETVNKATNEKIDRERSRADTGEGRGLAMDRGQQERMVAHGQNISLGQGMVALAALVLSVVIFFATKGQ